jgi:hypothetical protein
MLIFSSERLEEEKAMLLPSISMLLSGAGVTAILFVANWFIWNLPINRNFRVDPRAIVLTGPPTHADVYAARAADDSGFKHVA